MFNQDNPFFFLFFFLKQRFFQNFFHWKIKAYSHNSEATSFKQLCCTIVTRILNYLNCFLLMFLN